MTSRLRRNPRQKRTRAEPEPLDDHYVLASDAPRHNCVRFEVVQKHANGAYSSFARADTFKGAKSALACYPDLKLEISDHWREYLERVRDARGHSGHQPMADSYLGLRLVDEGLARREILDNGTRKGIPYLLLTDKGRELLSGKKYPRK